MKPFVYNLEVKPQQGDSPFSVFRPLLSPENCFTHYQLLKQYEAKLNDLIKDYPEDENVVTILDLLLTCGDDEQVLISACALLNHILYFQQLKEYAGMTNVVPDCLVTQHINKKFGGFDMFKQQFMEMALNAEVKDGWLWLTFTQNALEIFFYEGEGNPAAGLLKEKAPAYWGLPVLGVDLFQHAYADYGEKRLMYLERFFQSINWDAVNLRYSCYLKSLKL